MTTSDTRLHGAAAVEAAIRDPRVPGQPAIVAFLTGGFPALDAFTEHAGAVSQVADVLEIGVPFRDPMADGVTIQAASHTALDRGASLAGILERLTARRGDLGCPLLLMSYLNPLLAFGLERLAETAPAAGVAGFIVPDLPLDESTELNTLAMGHGLAHVQLATPATTDERLATLCTRSSGFVYAVTVNGTTGGGATPDRDAATAHLRRVKATASIPVCAGFGIKTADDVAALTGVVDGAIVGSALIAAIERGEDPARFVQQLRGPTNPAPQTDR